MWPWEHLAVGYLAYSGYTRLRYGRAPADKPAVALAITTQFPDLIDKPLAWTVDVLPSGYSFGHSVFVATALLALVLGISRHRDVPAVGSAVAIGYTSHLLGDLLYPVIRGGGTDVTILLWPLVARPRNAPLSLIAETSRLFAEFVVYLGSPRGVAYLGLELALVGGACALWFLDGRPGFGCWK